MARALALAVAIAAALLAVSGAGGSGVQTPKRGGTVTVAGVFGGRLEGACLNPYRSCGADSLSHVDEVLEGAFEVGPDRVRPNLVTSVDINKTPPFTLTYHIRPEARWSDGVAITARDFVFTHDAIRRLPGAPDSHRTHVRRVRAVDAKTVEVVLASRFNYWRGYGGLFEFVLPRHALQGEDLDSVWTDRIDNPKTGGPVGSGPFLVERWERGKRLVLRRNSEYWGTHTAHLERLVMRFDIDDPVEALRSGALDVYQIRLGLDPGAARGFLRIPGVRHRFASGVRLEHFEIHGWGQGGHPALRDKRVRRALAYGVDRVALVRTIFGELVSRMQPTESAVFLPSNPSYVPNWRRYRHRPDLARRLLEQAGCRRGADGIYTCAGERLSLRLVAGAGIQSRRRALELVQPQLRAVGVEVRPTYVAGSALFTQLIPSGEWDIALFAHNLAPEVPVDAAFRCKGPANVSGYCQRLVTRELDQATRILDPAEYARAVNRADVQMARDVPVIPLWHEPSLAAFRSTIRGFVPSEPLVAWNAENWWLAE